MIFEANNFPKAIHKTKKNIKPQMKKKNQNAINLNQIITKKTTIILIIIKLLNTKDQQKI